MAIKAGLRGAGQRQDLPLSVWRTPPWSPRWPRSATRRPTWACGWSSRSKAPGNGSGAQWRPCPSQWQVVSAISWALSANRTRPAVKDINVVILLIADSGGLQNHENLLLRTFPLMGGRYCNEEASHQILEHFEHVEHLRDVHRPLKDVRSL